VEEYEDRVHPLPKTDPGKTLAHPLEERGLKPGDLAAVLPKTRVSEILVPWPLCLFDLRLPVMASPPNFSPRSPETNQAGTGLAGKRAISKDQAKGLARFFRVPVELFL